MEARRQGHNHAYPFLSARVMPSARSRPRIFNDHIVIIHDPELLAAYLSGRHLTLAYFGWYWYALLYPDGVGLFYFKAAASNSDHQ